MVGKGASWRYYVTPLTPDLPILSHTIYEVPGVTEDEAIADAKQRIDPLLGWVDP